MSPAAFTYVRWLDELDDGQLAFAGGKAINLARLRRLRVDVPNGFVVHGSTADGALPAVARDEVLRFYRRIASPLVAVRSSAVGEDSSAASFAGQGCSVLNVQGQDKLLEAIGSVLRSMQATPAQSYARRMGMASAAIVVHVVVQEMIPAESSGVLFTADPLGEGNDLMIVNATWGLGEPLVSGQIIPDQITLEKTSGQVKQYAIGSKESTLDASGLHATEPKKSTTRCLNDHQLRQLAQTGRRIEAAFGCPQDIEWAWADHVHILQARPMTNASRMDTSDAILRREIHHLQRSPGVGQRAWTATGIAEMLPCPTPLSWDIASRLMSGTEGYGLAQRRLGYDPAPGSILQRIAGHTYVDLDRQIGLFWRHAPLGYDLDDIRDNPLAGALPRQILQWRKLRPSLLLTWPLLIWQVFRTLLRLRQAKQRFLPLFQQQTLANLSQYMDMEGNRDIGNLTNIALAQCFGNRLDHFLLESSPILMAGSILAAMSYRELEDLLIDRLGAAGVELTQQLLCGLEPNPTLDLHRRLRQLALGQLSRAAFLDQFGHRCGEEFELATPRWREDPHALDLQIASTASLAADHSKGESIRQEAQARLDSLSGSWGAVAGRLVRSKLELARRLFPLRQWAKDWLMREYELLRPPLLKLDRGLELDGGIFYLLADEITPAITDPQTARSKIAARRREHRLCKGLHMPPVIMGDSLPALLERRVPSPGTQLQGIGVSPGQASGPLRILQSPDDMPHIRDGDILAIPSLDPAWTNVFTRAAGLIALRGAILSHGAILAREFGLPAVVNVAVDSLAEEQTVTIDGTNGTISAGAG